MKLLLPNQIIGFSSLEDLPYDPKAPIKKGGRIEKIKGRADDIHKVGDKGKTVGAFKQDGEWCYYVDFDNLNVATSAVGIYDTIMGIMGFKIKEIPNDK